jgi:hypothetical protein
MSLIAEKSSDSILPKKFDLVENLKKNAIGFLPSSSFPLRPLRPLRLKKN